MDSNVIIEIENTPIYSTIEVESNITEVIVDAGITNRNATIDVTNTVKEVTVEVQPQVKEVTINVESGRAPNATESVKGKMKLYASLGVNEDGSVSQKIITEAISGKVDSSIDYELVGVSHLIHRTNMSIRQDNMNMKLILR
jgi:hypothetical protein